MAADNDVKGRGLRADEGRAGGGLLTTERAVALLVLGALLILGTTRRAFRGALGD